MGLEEKEMTTTTSHLTGGEHFNYWIVENKHMLLCPMPEDADELKELLRTAHAAGVSHSVDYVRALNK